MSITIPSTLDEAKDQLNALGRLLTAKEWERAAIVWAFTTDEIGGGPRTTGLEVVQLSAREFSELGIAGLKSRDTIRIYRNAWQWAIDNGHAEETVPGDEIELPSISWDQRPKSTPVAPSQTQGWDDLSNEQRAERVAETVRSDPEAAQAIADNREAREAVARANFEHDAEAEETANVADPQRSEVGDATRRANLRDAWRKLRYDTDRASAWLDRELESLSEEDKTAMASQVRLTQSTLNLAMSKLTGEFDTELAALLDEGGTQ